VHEWFHTCLHEWKRCLLILLKSMRDLRWRLAFKVPIMCERYFAVSVWQSVCCAVSSRHKHEHDLKAVHGVSRRLWPMSDRWQFYLYEVFNRAFSARWTVFSRVSSNTLEVFWWRKLWTQTIPSQQSIRPISIFPASDNLTTHHTRIMENHKVPDTDNSELNLRNVSCADSSNCIPTT